MKHLGAGPIRTKQEFAPMEKVDSTNKESHGRKRLKLLNARPREPNTRIWPIS